MKSSRIETVAAIDVGSNSLRMIIAQISSDGKYSILEDVEKATNIGKDTFSMGKIEVSSIHETCEALKGYMQLMDEYEVKNYSAVTTSGIREAENKEYVLEQIRLRTGLVVKVINNAEERFFMYKALEENLPNINRMYEEGAMIVNVGSGGVEVTIYHEGNLMFTEYVKVGSLRLHEILSQIAVKTLDFPDIMEEFVESKIGSLFKFIKKMNIMNFIGLGGDLMIISTMCGEKKESGRQKFVNKQSLSKLYMKIRQMTEEQISSEYSIPRNKAELILPALIVFNKFLAMTAAEGIYTPLVSLKHGLLADLIDEQLDTKRKKAFIDDIISSVKYIAKKYSLDEEHYEHIEKTSLVVFDQTRKIHILGERERLYLQIASILHDVGKYVNLANHDKHCYNIIFSEDIMGFSNNELKIVANTAKYHGEEVPSLSHESYRTLTEKDRLLVSKLAAILKLSEALDTSHKRKIRDLKIAISGRELVFKVEAQEDILLEEWNFAGNAMFFEEVLGYRPVLRRLR